MNDYDNSTEAVDFTLIIPSGHFVSGCDLDDDPPYCLIVHKDQCGSVPKKLLLPKSLAYFLRTHWCGSKKMHQLIERGEQRRIKNGIKELLALDEP